MKLHPIRSLLVKHLGGALDGAIIYGSVAAGRAGPTSDIDCFVITNNEFDERKRRRTAAAFAELQRTLGFTPDAAYPIELFSVDTCRAILEGDVLRRILTDAAIDGIDPHVAESDEIEVLRALLDQRLVLQPSTALDSLTANARTLAQRYPTGPNALLRTLGLVDLPSVGR